jgi:hypothetical protein
MTGLFGVHPLAGDGVGTKLLESLPAPPASALAGAVIRCDCQREIDAVIEWYGDMRAIRPAFAVILVADHRFGATLASCPHPVRAVVPPSDLAAGRQPQDALDQLRAASVEGRVLDRLVLQFGGALLEHLPLVRSLVAHAVRGGTVSAAARDLGVSVDTVRRRLTAAGVPPRDFSCAPPACWLTRSAGGGVPVPRPPLPRVAGPTPSTYGGLGGGTSCGK